MSSSTVLSIFSLAVQYVMTTPISALRTCHTFISCVFLPSSTNLTEMAKAVRLLAALSASQLEGDDLLKAARALAAATAALLNAAQPENMEVATGKRAMGADWGGL